MSQERNLVVTLNLAGALEEGDPQEKRHRSSELKHALPVIRGLGFRVPGLKFPEPYTLNPKAYTLNLKP